MIIHTLRTYSRRERHFSHLLGIGAICLADESSQRVRYITSRWSTTISSKVNWSHAIDLMALCGANVATEYPGFAGDRRPRTPPCCVYGSCGQTPQTFQHSVLERPTPRSKFTNDREQQPVQGLLEIKDTHQPSGSLMLLGLALPQDPGAVVFFISRACNHC